MFDPGTLKYIFILNVMQLYKILVSSSYIYSYRLNYKLFYEMNSWQRRVRTKLAIEAVFGALRFQLQRAKTSVFIHISDVTIFIFSVKSKHMKLKVSMQLNWHRNKT